MAGWRGKAVLFTGVVWLVAVSGDGTGRAANASDGGSSLSGAGIAASSFVTISTGMMVNSVTENGSRTTDIMGGKSQVTVTDGSVATQTEFQGELGDGVKGRVSTTVKLDKCPDAEGKVKVSLVSKSALSKKGSKATANLTVTIDGNMHYDEDAKLQNDWEYEARVENAQGAGGGKGTFVDVNFGSGLSGPKVNRTSSETGPADIATAEQQKKLLEIVAMVALMNGKDYVEAGNCVTLTAETTPSKRSRLQPSTSFDILARPRAKTDGAPAGGTVIATLQGGTSVSPEGAKVAADARYSYVAPGEPNKKATVKLVARSKRGVGRADVNFDTNTAQPVYASGGADEYHGEGNICDLSKPFVISGSGVTHNFTPTSDTAGTYKYSGNLRGFAVKGEGTYKVDLGPDGTSGKLTASGGGSVKTPMGVFSNNGDEVYTLVPGKACE